MYHVLRAPYDRLPNLHHPSCVFSLRVLCSCSARSQQLHFLSFTSYPNTSTPLTPILLAAVTMFDDGLSFLLCSVCHRRIPAANVFNGPTKFQPHRFTPFVVSSSYDHANLLLPEKHTHPSSFLHLPPGKSLTSLPPCAPSLLVVMDASSARKMIVANAFNPRKLSSL